MSSRFFHLVTLALILISCGQSEERDFSVYQYNGMILPTPEPVRAFPEQPPPAWLIIGDKAIPATYGSFCVRGACADMAVPQLRNDLISAKLSANAQAIIVIGANAVKEFDVRVGNWRHEPTAPFDPAATREISAEQKTDGKLTILTPGPITPQGDQLLAVSIAFESGDASYLWRLNPAP